MAGHATAVPPTDLERLLAMERRLGERLAAARAARDSVIAEAEARARTREAMLNDELDREAQHLAESLADEQRQREREILEMGDRQAAAFAATPPEVVTVLARELALQFLADVVPR